MDIGYAVIGKYKGEKWKSEIYQDAQDMIDKHQSCLSDCNYSDLKTCTAYIHYEEIDTKY